MVYRIYRISVSVSDIRVFIWKKIGYWYRVIISYRSSPALNPHQYICHLSSALKVVMWCCSSHTCITWPDIGVVNGGGGLCLPLSRLSDADLDLMCSASSDSSLKPLTFSVFKVVCWISKIYHFKFWLD